MSKINAINKLLGRLLLPKFNSGLNAYIEAIENRKKMLRLIIDIDHKRYDLNSPDYNDEYRKEIIDLRDMFHIGKINDILKYLGEEEYLTSMKYNHLNTEIYSDDGEIHKKTQIFLDKFLKGYNAVNDDSLHFIKTTLEFFKYVTLDYEVNPRLMIQTNFDAGDIQSSMKFFMKKSSSINFSGYNVYINGTQTL